MRRSERLLWWAGCACIAGGAVLLAVALSGCAGSLERSRAESSNTASDVAYCRRLDERAATWGAIGKAAVVLSSGSGVSTLPIDADQKTLRLSLAGGSLGFAALAVAALYASDAASESWARDCLRPPAPVGGGQVASAEQPPDCLSVILQRFAMGSTCAEAQLAVDASDGCRLAYPGGVTFDCSEFGRGK
jgi:hypothetical protein